MAARAFGCLLLVCLLATAAGATPYQFGRESRVYQQIDALSRQGLLEGYPAGPWAGPEALTGQEAASLVLRAVRGVAAQYALRSAELAQAAAGQAPACPEGAPAALVRPEDLARLEKLIAELRTELVTMGADVQSLSATVAELSASMFKVQAQAAAASEELRQHRISGYIQARYVVDRARTPESTFAVKRAYLTIAGPVSDRTRYLLQVDALGANRAGESEVLLNEASISHLLGGSTWLTAGQLPVPFGFELPYSSRDREAPERSTGIGALFPRQIWDRGVTISGTPEPWRWAVTLINGTGAASSDNNDRKDVVLNLARRWDRLEAGSSAYLGKLGAIGGPQADKHLYDTWAQYQLGSSAYLRGELIMGRAALPAELAAGDHPVLAWSGLVGYRPNPRHLLVARYDQFDPNRDRAGDSVPTTTLAFLHWLDPVTRLRLAQEFRPRRAGIFTSELQVSY